MPVDLPASLAPPPALICPAPPQPLLTLDYSFLPVKLHRERTLKQLSETKIGNTGITRREFPITSGFTRGSFAVKYEVQIAYRGLPAADAFCVWPQAMQMHITYTPDVYIANEYTPGRCRYQDTLTHEMRHVAADKDFIKQQGPALLAGATKNLAATPPAPLPHAKLAEAEKQIIDKAKAFVAAELKRTEPLRLKKQAAIDTRAEYLRDSHACAR